MRPSSTPRLPNGVRGACLALAACGSPTTSPDAATAIDAAPSCDPNAPFLQPNALAELNSMFDDVSPRLSPDELVVAFARRTGAGLYDLYTATRDSRDAAFAAPSLLSTVNSVNSDVWPTVSPDGLLLMFDSDRGTGTYHIHISTRASTSQSFGTAALAVALADLDSHPMLANARALYFSAPGRGGLGMRDIFRSEVDSTGATSRPVAVPGGVNSIADEVTPAVTADELRMFFRRTVNGEDDIFVATRATSLEGFGPATPIIATPGVAETPGWVSPDGCRVYFTQSMGAPAGEDIFVARRGS